MYLVIWNTSKIASLKNVLISLHATHKQAIDEVLCMIEDDSYEGLKHTKIEPRDIITKWNYNFDKKIIHAWEADNNEIYLILKLEVK